MPKLILRHENKIDQIDTEEIQYIESKKGYVNIVTQQRTIISSKQISHFENYLKQHGFLRIDKSCIVNLSKMREIVKGTKNIVLNCGTSLKISRRKYPTLNLVLRKYTD